MKSKFFSWGNILSILAMTLVFSFLLIGNASAGANTIGTSGEVFSTAQTATKNVFNFTVKTIYIIGAIAILALAVLSAFGRFNWKWLMAAVGAMFMVAMVDQGLKFVTGSDFSSDIETDGSTAIPN